MNKNRNNKQSIIKKLKNRINWLENLVERCSDYISQLETELETLKEKYFELKKDHTGLVNWYWKAQKLIEENKRLKSENERLGNSNKALKMLLKEVIQEVDNTVNNFEKRKKELDRKLGFRWAEPCQSEIDYMHETAITQGEDEETEELKSELRKVMIQKLKKYNFDIKA